MLATAASVSAQIDFNIPTDTPNLPAEYKKELDKWTLLAYEGDRDAQFKVGVLSSNQQFREPDYEQAVYWYKQAARQGHVLAQYNLGHQYLTGVGVEKSEATAMQWWLKAAEQGHALAQFNLGRAYYLGIGLPVDLTKSRRWFESAARNNEPKSIEILEQLGWAKPGQYQPKSEPATSSATPTAVASVETNEPESTPKVVSKVVPIDEKAADSAQTKPATVDTPNAGEQASANTSSVTTPKTPATQDAPVEQTPNTKTTAISEVGSGDKQTEITDERTATVDRSIAVYTNPAVRSVLVAIIENGDELQIVSSRGKWTKVTSNSGVPVWVHGNFLNVAGDSGTIRGSSVNARSVPLVTTGTVVGQFDNGEEVSVLGKRDVWYRVMSPPRFAVWVRTSDLRAAIRMQDPAAKLLPPDPDKKVPPKANDLLTDQQMG